MHAGGWHEESEFWPNHGRTECRRHAMEKGEIEIGTTINVHKYHTVWQDNFDKYIISLVSRSFEGWR
jgi:hypothetical protein